MSLLRVPVYPKHIFIASDTTSFCVFLCFDCLKRNGKHGEVSDSALLASSHGNLQAGRRQVTSEPEAEVCTAGSMNLFFLSVPMTVTFQLCEVSTRQPRGMLRPQCLCLTARERDA